MTRVYERSLRVVTPNLLEATLLLQDGTLISGRGFGFPCRIVGEVVFNTGMVGYTEVLTDPSYRGQILCFTYPLIGNYGVPSYKLFDDFDLPRFFESDRIQVSGAIIQDLSLTTSHWSSARSLHEWFYDERIPGIWDIDTRSLTKLLRIHGVMMGALEVSTDSIDVAALKKELDKSKTYDEINFVDQVSLCNIKEYGRSDSRVVLVDCGAKNGIIRRLLRRDLHLIRVPYNTLSSEILSYRPSGVVVSNGPGDPKICTSTIKALKDVLNEDVPFLGICLGNQIYALVEGGNTFKLKYGHRGQNKPCIDLDTGRSYITSQNHGYAVDPDSIRDTDLRVWFVNTDDKTVEGLKHKSKPCIAVQFHPEASPGPYDTDFIFDVFNMMVRKAL